MKENRLSDDSLGSSSRESPLEAASPTRSYASTKPTDDSQDSFAGGGAIRTGTDEASRTMALQQEMRRTQDQFTGGETINEGREQSPDGSESEAESDQIQGGAPEGDEEEYQNSEAEQARILQEQKQQDARERAIQQRQIDRDKAEKRAYELKQKFNNLTRKSSEAGEFFSGLLDFGISDLLLLVQMNVQMIMKYILRPLITGGNPQLAALLKGRPWFDQSNGEDFMTVWFDLLFAILIFLFIAFCLAVMNGIIHPIDSLINTAKYLVQ